MVVDGYGRLLSYVNRIITMAAEIRSGRLTNEEMMNEIRHFDSGVFKSFLPKTENNVVRSFLTSYRAPCIYADVFADPHVQIDIFGFWKKDAKIPLHSHPNMSAYMKVIQGKIMIRSFSIVETGENEQLIAKYDGEKVISSESEDHCGFLEPIKGNVHEITALEDNTYFCDVFTPGTPQNCNFYSFQNAPVVGKEVMLYEIPCPREFSTTKIPFPNFDNIIKKA